MTEPSLEDLMIFSAETVLRTVYLPIDTNNPNFHPDWLKDLAMDRGNEKAAYEYLKNEHPLIEKAYLLQGKLPWLDLDILFYANEENRPLTEFQELVFTHSTKILGGVLPIRLNELGYWGLEDIGAQFRAQGIGPYYSSMPIDPSLAEIKSVGKEFTLDMLGTHDREGQTSNKMSASKKFEYTGGEAVLSYDFYMGKNGAINNFSIKFQMFNTKDTPADFSANIKVNQRPDGGYAAKAEITVKSAMAERLGSYDGLVTYVFGDDGSFEEIRLHGSKLVFTRADMEARESALANLQGIVVIENRYYFKLTDKPDSKNIYALFGASGEESHAITSLADGTLRAGDNCTLVPAAQLTVLPGLQYDMTMVQNYRMLAKEFGQIGLFRDAMAQGVDRTSLDYVSAIRSMANIQNYHPQDIPRLV
jgi:hypothetical protein